MKNATFGSLVLCAVAFSGSDTVSDVQVRFRSGPHGLPAEADRKNLSVKTLRKFAGHLLVRRFDQPSLLGVVDRVTKTLHQAGYQDCRVLALVDRADDGVSITIVVRAGPKSPVTVAARRPAAVVVTRFGGWPGEKRPARERDYVRFLGRRTDPGTITWHVQSASRVLLHPKMRTRVLLVGAVHFGRSDYYRSLERQLDSAEVVLAEGVCHPRDSAKVQWPPDIVFIRRGTHAATSAAGLSRQVVWERLYADDRWRMADLSIQKVVEMSKGVRISDDDKKWVAEMESLAASKEPSARQRARAWFVRDFFGPAGPPEPATEIREKILWNSLRDLVKAQKHRSVAVLYGAAHLARIENKLQEMGFRYYCSTWHHVFEHVEKR